MYFIASSTIHKYYEVQPILYFHILARTFITVCILTFLNLTHANSNSNPHIAREWMHGIFSFCIVDALHLRQYSKSANSYFIYIYIVPKFDLKQIEQ